MNPSVLPDSQWFRSPDGKHLLAGSPLTSFTVSEAGAAVLDAIESETSLPINHQALTTRLLATGAVHPVTESNTATSDISVVIPAYITDTASEQRLLDLVDSLHGLTVIVVDDLSPQHISIPHVEVIRNTTNGGPGNARNLGLASVATKFVAFVDADTSVTTENILELTSILRDEKVVLVAPRVRSFDNKTFLTQYESFHSPLDLGTSPAVVRPMSRVSYVPAAVLVGRTSELRELGPFDSSLRIGEDVDLVWRISESGGIVRYVPSVECGHYPRTTWRALLRQRFNYGSSAAQLDNRHPRSASPLRAHFMLLLPALAVLSGNVYSALLLIAPTLIYFIFTLRSTKTTVRIRQRLIWIGFTSTLRLLASAVRRAWWPLFVLGFPFFDLPIIMMTFAVLAPLGYALFRKKPRDSIRYLILRVLDDLAYGAGVWFGAFRTRNFRCLVPVITFRRTSVAK